MKRVWKRLFSLCLAGCLAGAALALPAAAAPAALQPAGSMMDTLLEMPILGDLLRLLTGSSDGSAPESAGTGENATAETATRETATPESSTPESGAPPTQPDKPDAPKASDWAEEWMAGSILAGAAYPAGDAAEEQQLPVPVTLWSSVQTGLDAAIQVSLREETNFGDLAADAVGYAVASTAVWQQTQELQDLPLVALVDGESLKANVPAGTTLTADNLGEYLENSDLALVVVTPQKLHEILNLALAGAQDPIGENFGSFVQVSGLRFTYRQQDGNYQLESMWLPGLEGEQPLALDDAEGQLALALPADLLVQYGLNADAGYQNYLAVPDGSDPAQPAEGNGADSAPQDAAGQTDGGADTGNGSPAAEAPADAEQQPPVMETPLTLHDALLGLPNNCDAETLAVLLARQGTMGRILPDAAETYTAQLPTTGTAAAGTVTVYVDGRPVTGTLDETGLLTIEGLAPGGHTVSLTQDGETRYVSSITHLGTAQGTPLPALEQPEGWEVTPIATPTPTASATPTPAPASSQTVTVQGEPDTTPTPTPTPTPAPVPAATPTPTPAAARTPAPVRDPLEGTIIGTTPAPTLSPTPTPSPTPEPTLSPEEEQQVQEAEQASSMLPLYIGIGVLAIGAVTVAVVLVRRRMEEGGKRSRYHRGR